MIHKINKMMAECLAINSKISAGEFARMLNSL